MYACFIRVAIKAAVTGDSRIAQLSHVTYLFNTLELGVPQGTTHDVRASVFPWQADQLHLLQTANIITE